MDFRTGHELLQNAVSSVRIVVQEEQPQLDLLRANREKAAHVP